MSTRQTLWEAGDLAIFETDELGLPACRLTGTRPFHYPPNTSAPDGMAETDPWFILGNYGLTVFPHASGSYQLLHTERGFARLNHDGSDSVTGRDCGCEIEIDDVSLDILREEAGEKRFGCGFAEWRYKLNDITVLRRMDSIPSRDSNDRIPAFRLSITLRNDGDSSHFVHLSESLGVRYHYANWKNPPLGRKAARYPVECRGNGQHCSATFRPEELLPLVFDQPGRLAQADGQPCNVHLDVLDSGSICRIAGADESAQLRAERNGELAPGATITINLLIGWSDATCDWNATRERMAIEPAEMRRLWSERLPEFPTAEAAVRGELQWHAHTLYAMATYDQRYRRTFIPQGTLYEFGLGVAAVTRDHAMHALPACSYDPDLARSVLEYLARHTDLRGLIQHTDEGAGIVPQGADQKSDNQIFALLLAVEYLEQTGDVDCLNTEHPFFPCGSGSTGTLLDRIARWVSYLRDGISTGRNGLVRIMCSDLSDTLHSAFPHLQYNHGSYHKVFNGESYVNTTMAIHVLRKLHQWLDQNPGASPTQQSLLTRLRDASREYEGRLRNALFDDLQDRQWVPRGRVGDHVLGDTDAFAAPQAFIFNNPDLPEARRREIWDAVKPRLWDGEPFGVLLREGEGQHRCGMIWYAWSGMFAWALTDIEPDAAREALDRLSLRRRAELEPEQWMGLWSNSDVTWGYSVKLKGQIPGTTRVGYVKPFPHFCAHVHAWPLMLWYRLN